MTIGPILVTGGSGQIGNALAQLAESRHIECLAPTSADLNLADPASIYDWIGKAKWSAVINCAAYTAVDRAEGDTELATAINTDGPAVMARESAARGIPIVHVSTDYVFDGSKTAPYLEDDPINPLGVYGKTKADGEAAVRRENPRHAIVRTAWVQSASGANFINTMISKGTVLDEMRVVGDQIGCPSSAVDIADALLEITTTLGRRSGIWHFVNGGEASWHDLAAHVFNVMAMRGMKVPRLIEIATTEYPTPARRPANSRLCTRKFEHDFGQTPRDWRTAMDDILAERLS
jgi:dTDP-4-dehydrorhamnose reductase